ncbi:hypothetical protein [Nocardia sp. NPDC049526]|uniref:hypothetical protein n=1 Tax=Nocardia sp. NPDC049526 TaxID=3364316 RepID=UPI00378FCFCA
MADSKVVKVLNPGDSLNEGDWVESPDGNYRFGLKNGDVVKVFVPTGDTKTIYNSGDASKIVFETKKNGSEYRLEAHNDAGDELWSANPDDKKRRGGGYNDHYDEWDTDDDADQRVRQFALTNDGAVVGVKHALGDWKGNLGADAKNVLWFDERPNLELVAYRNYVKSFTRDPEMGDTYSTRDPEAGDKGEDPDFRLRIEVPPGKASPELMDVISVVNDRLAYLAFQMGHKRKPVALQSESRFWNGKLEDDLIKKLQDGAAAKSGAKGEAVEAYEAAAGQVGALASTWDEMDSKFQQEDRELTKENWRVFKRMYDTVQEAREDIWKILKNNVRLESGKQTREFGIQNIVEEWPIYPILKQVVLDCRKDVADYAKQAEERAKRGGDFPGYPSEKKGAKEEKPKKKEEEKPEKKEKEKPEKKEEEKPATKTTPSPTTITPPSYTPPPTTPTPQDMFPSPDSNPTLDDLGLGSTDSTDSPTGTQPIADSTSGDTPSGTDLRSLIRTATQDAGTGSTVAPSAPQQPTNSSGDAMGQIGQMMAMNALNQNRVPGDDRGYEDRESREDRQRERERNRAAQTATTNPAAQTAPPGVVAPAYVGSPPPVTTPGAMVDVQIGENTVKASQPVAEALQKQVQNTAIDAMSAYRGTAGELSADHPPAVINSRDPQAFNTGDIIQWERHNALIVKESNQLFVLDNGQLIPFDPGKPPLEEKYGLCTGYVHPTGLDSAAGGDPVLAAAAPPNVAAPKSPAGPPPVEPPQI